MVHWDFIMYLFVFVSIEILSKRLDSLFCIKRWEELMNIDKAFGIEQKKITVRGTQYTLQNVPLKEFYKMQERCRDAHANPLASELYDEIFKNVIVSPKVSWDNYDDVDEVEELMQEALRFLRRREKPQADEIAGKEQSEE